MPLVNLGLQGQSSRLWIDGNFGNIWVVRVNIFHPYIWCEYPQCVKTDHIAFQIRSKIKVKPVIEFGLHFGCRMQTFKPLVTNLD